MKVRKIKLILIIIQILMIIFPSIFSIASSVEIGDTFYVERGPLGFYTIQYWNSNKWMWMYITYSRTYYTDKDGNKNIAYCMDPDLDGVGWLPGEYEGYETEVKYKFDDERIWLILKNGYPNASPEDLGVETEDDAYLATKQAVYCILRNKQLGEIRNYYRAGEEEINNQKLEDIQRRGKKVVDAIYKLVDIAYNQNEPNTTEPQIVSDGEFKPDENEEYYSQKYRITEGNLNTTIKITNMDNAPRDTFVSDIDGNPKTTFKAGDVFKVMVPKASILGDSNVKVYYEKNMESYPVYYVASKIEGKQNYVILSDKIEKEEGEIDLYVKDYASNLKIIKTDAETNQPIQGATFQIEYDSGEKTKQLVTDKDGTAWFRDFYQGNITVREISPNEEYVLDSKEYEVSLDYSEMYILNITNTHKKCNLEIKKVDKDDNNVPLAGVEFDLIDKDGKTVSHLTTDDEGNAIVNNINTGEYTLRETKTNQQYEIGVDHNITINWNDTLKIKIENEKKKGNIKIIKQDEEDENIKLSGVKFEILNDKDEKIQTLITDEEGETISEKLPIGTYYIKEIETGEKYVLDNRKIEVQVQEDEIKEVKIANARKKGKIKIIKTSEDQNNVLNLQKGSPIPNVKFAIYNSEGKFVEELNTDNDGIAISSNLYTGNYSVKELETDKWYICDEQKYNVEIKENNEIAELNLTNKSKNPEVEIIKKCKNIIKPNEELDYSFEIKNSGNTELEKMTWYDILPNEYANITKIETGTYNQEVIYDIFYKTNQKDEYMVIKKGLNSNENHYIDLTKIHLEEGEQITELKVCFGNVKVGFKSMKNPHIYMKLKDGINNGEKIENHTILEGYNLDYKASDEDSATSIIYNIVEKKKLPRTGY